MSPISTTKTRLSLVDYYLIHRLDVAEYESNAAERARFGARAANEEALRVLYSLWPYRTATAAPAPGDGDFARYLGDKMAEQYEKAMPGLLGGIGYELASCLQFEWKWHWDLYNGPYIRKDKAAEYFKEAESPEGILYRLARRSGIFRPLDDEAVAELLAAPAPWDGKTIAKRFTYLKTGQRNDLIYGLQQGLTTGEDTRRIAERIAPTLGKFEERAVRIARTETMRVSGEAGRAFANANKQYLQGLEAVATFDDRTCVECGSLDGQKWYYNPAGGQRGVGGMPRYPIHPQCRCTLVPFTDFWSEIGIEAPPEFRASMFGPVKNPTFDDWLRSVDKAGHKEVALKVLGPKRYELWKANKLNLRSFTRLAQDKSGGVLPILKKLPPPPPVLEKAPVTVSKKVYPPKKKPEPKPKKKAPPKKREAPAKPYEMHETHAELTRAQRLTNNLKNHQTYRRRMLTPKELEGIQAYTAGDYEDINNLLRGTGQLSHWEVTRARGFMRGLDRALDKCPKYAGPSYRGIRIVGRELEAFARKVKKGAVITDRGYTSSSAFRDRMFRITHGVRVKIIGKNGRYIAPVSSFTSEAEVLFKKGTKFLVKDFGVHQDGRLLDVLLEEL